ncbi:hypothetical protein ACLMJK_001336 [Lecanora helva]
MAAGCLAKDDPDSKWPSFCPNKGASIFYAILFAMTTIAHIAQAIIYRKGYSWVVIMSATWQTGCYVFHTLSIIHPTNETFYIVWFLLMLLAPLWINAYVYMALGRMVYNFTSSARILKVKAWRFGLYFVLLDIFAFIIQAGGASMASGNNISDSTMNRGLHIYMVGVGLQQLFVLCFIYLATRFQREMNRDLPAAEQRRPRRLLYVLYAVLILITIRIIFRLIEYAKGVDSGIPQHEVYQYVFDSTMMLFGLVLLNVVHPGRIMPGKECDFPSRKQRKAAGKNGIQGRAGAGNTLPMYLMARSSSPVQQPGVEPAYPNSTYPKINAQTHSPGFVTEYGR